MDGTIAVFFVFPWIPEGYFFEDLKFNIPPPLIFLAFLMVLTIGLWVFEVVRSFFKWRTTEAANNSDQQLDDALLSLLIFEGDAIIKLAGDAQGSLSSTNLDHVVNWHRSATKLITERSRDISIHVPQFKMYDPLNKTMAALSGTQRILNSLSRTPGGSTLSASTTP